MSLEDTQGGAPASVDVTPSPVEAPAPAAPVETQDAPQIEDHLSKIWAKHNPDRDDDGKYVSRETPVKQDEPSPVAAELAKTEVPPVEAPAPEAKPAVDAPRAWSAEQKAIWAKIPAEAQPLIAQRESELHEIKTAAGRLTAEYQPIRDTLTTHRDYFGQIGQAPAQWLQNALQVSRALDGGNAPAVIKHLADQYGVDLGQLYDPLAPPPNTEILELRREIQALKSANQNEQANRAASTQAAQMSEFDRIANEFKAKHPDAAEIEDDIVAEIQAIRSQTPNIDPAALLAKAYERAAWANETTRTKRLEAQVADRVKAQEAARVSAARESAAKARSAAGVNVAGSPNPTGETDDLDTLLRSTYRKARSAR